MSNNIEKLDAALKKQAAQDLLVYNDNFDKKLGELTAEDKKKLEAIKTDTEVVVTETNPDGTETTIPYKDYAAKVDENIKSIKAVTADGERLVKAINQGDIHETLDDVKEKAHNNALKAFKQFSVSERELTDEEILAANDKALEVLQEYFGLTRIVSDDIVPRLKKMTLKQMAEILPADFMSFYIKPKEIETNNINAKERLISTIAYFATVGPEMDYLNEYIDNQNHMIEVTNRMMKCGVDFTEMLQDPKMISEIATEAEQISPPDTSVYAKHIVNDSQRIHNEFAQKAIVCNKLADSYKTLLDEYKDDEAAIKEIENQINESHKKADVYKDVVNLDLMRELWDTLATRLKAEKRNDYKNLEREAIAALDRCRKSKQNVPFPIYDAKLAKKTPELYKLYITQYPQMIKSYNATIIDIQKKEPEATKECEIVPIQIEGYPDDVVEHYFSLMLLILFGRIMKKLSSRNVTKYDAILLDAYFQCFCKMGTDIYMMNDVWLLMKDFVEYAIKTWPRPTKKR